MGKTHLDVLETKYQIVLKWLQLQQQGYSIFTYLKEEGIHSIVIYGVTELSMTLFNENRNGKNHNIIKAISDKKIKEGDSYRFDDIPCVSPIAIREIVTDDDIVLVTAMGWYDEIKIELKRLGIKRIASIQEIIYDMCSKYIDGR